MGLTLQEGTALMAAGHLGVREVSRDGYMGSATAKPGKLTGEYFRNLLQEKWEAYTASGCKPQFKAAGKELYVLPKDVLLLQDGTLKNIATYFSTNEAALQSAFASAWEKLMDAGRQHAPASPPTKQPVTSSTTTTTTTTTTKESVTVDTDNAHLAAPMLTIMAVLITFLW